MRNRIWTKDAVGRMGEEVFVAGWVSAVRSHGKLLFIDLRDMTGEVQVVFGADLPGGVTEAARKLRPEWVIGVTGLVQKRPQGMENPKLPTGNIEISAKELTVFSQAQTLPFAIDSAGYDLSEEKRLRWRYLDLRRPRLHRNLTARQQVTQTMRDFLQKEGFVEIETPILTKSTPEGARDFLVPSRLQPGNFYALPQSPQQYKQLLQVAGFERYFQIARCFRDEDPRADRQAEFTQLDIEMSFVEQEDILDLIERLYIEIVPKLFPEKKIKQIPFPRLNYKEVMEKYNSDKPDLRENTSDPNELAFAFVVNFPMFEWRPSSAKASEGKKEEEGLLAGDKKKRLAGRSLGEGRWDAVHHPFTRPQIDDIKEIKKDPGNILAFQYDFVLNGCEIGGGSLRSYKPEILEAVFEVMGHKKSEIKEKFGHLLEAFGYGVPPHGGIAPGIDRFLSIVLNEQNIREVIAFPKTGDSRDLMMGAPSEVAKGQLAELKLAVTQLKPKSGKGQ